MRNFARALRIATAHPFNVVGCVFTSLVIAVLWGGNLTAIFWVVDVVMNDQSIPEWIDQKVAVCEREVAQSDRWLAQLNEFRSIDASQIHQRLNAEIEHRRFELAAHSMRSIHRWNDVEIAKKTSLENSITRLEALQKLPAEQVLGNLTRELADVNRHKDVYTRRADRFRWVAPAAHRWMPTTPFRTLLVVCLFVLVCSILKGLFRIWNTIVVARLGHVVGYELRTEVYGHVLCLDMANFTEAGRGDLMTRCTSDVNSIGHCVQRLFGQVLLEPLKIAVCFGLAAWVSWPLLVLTIIVVPPAAYSIYWLGKALKRTHRRAMQQFSSIHERLSETLGGISLIKAFTMEPDERNRFQLSARNYYRRQMRIAMYNSFVSPTVELLGLVMILLASVMGGYLVLGQQTHILGLKISDMPLTHGMMSVFFAMLAGMGEPARRISNEFSHIQQGLAAADRVYEVLDSKPAIADPPEPVPLPRLAQSLRFESVSFQYDPGKVVVRNVGLDVSAGETIAVVGPNGCGKTTLLHLLQRFYDPAAGRITIDGVDIRNVRLSELRSRFGLVSQDVLLFNDTVANNISYGSPDASQCEIEAAARKAHAHQFITEKLPEGYQTFVGPAGSRLSGGQRQRISLARAILRNPEILLLDEATSQIDIESEQLIFEVLKDFSRDRTTIMITHRTSMISLADRVIVMDHGRIVDHGAHHELLARCDLYRRLCHVSYRASA
jgi:ATP-binding cassette subfamily B protein/subfamily B ATP-binding cassette protein MsbA